ncbi:uncharacterized protein LACBIDRAFT_322498 [Laccaria bicolor S238N-H82]|uniref:Predicted protein n=1 Tax=Laccaria bicolor (strain S238N-H82 / ATCC MYA-4686) TaxID=486041 RepID=B0CWI0_LACBS|nr:uncharacterized protein LACBIDRAFT_322498 [Laccaria bicolor S238N-H82]EDR13513.1 predicted protein [Laccaria bicolor S238N-H82]|eukprot:XP_001876011.1 predicted protein [Laccaria bicolor S238N-H82]
MTLPGPGKSRGPFQHAFFLQLIRQVLSSEAPFSLKQDPDMHPKAAFRFSMHFWWHYQRASWINGWYDILPEAPAYIAKSDLFKYETPHMSGIIPENGKMYYMFSSDASTYTSIYLHSMEELEEYQSSCLLFGAKWGRG